METRSNLRYLAFATIFVTAGTVAGLQSSPPGKKNSTVKGGKTLPKPPVKQPPVKVPSNILQSLREAELRSDKIVAVDNANMTVYDALLAGKKTLDAAKPTPDAADAIVALKDALAAIQNNVLSTWQEYGVPPDSGPVPTPVDVAKAMPKDKILAQLAATEKNLTDIMTAYESALKSAKTATPADVESAYLACRQRITDVKLRINKAITDLQTAQKSTKASDLSGTAQSASVDIYNDVYKLWAADYAAIKKGESDIALAGTGTPDAFKTTLAGVTPALGFGSKAGDVEPLFSEKVIAALQAINARLAKASPNPPRADLKPLDPKSTVILAEGGVFVTSLEGAVKSQSEAFDSAAFDGKSTLQALIHDPAQQTSEARARATVIEKQAKKEADAQAAISAFVDSLKQKPLSAFIPANSTAAPAVSLKNLGDLANRMNASASLLTVLVSQLNAEYPDNMASWTEAEVNLYYFDDVERLLGMINPNVEKKRDDTARNTYETSQAELLKAQEALINAHAKLSDARRALKNAQEDLRLEQARSDAAKADLTKAANQTGKAKDAATVEVDKAQHDVDLAQVEVDADKRELDAANAALSAESDATKKPPLQAAVDRKLKKYNDSQTDLARKQVLLKDAQAKQTEAGDKASSAQTDLDNAKDRVADLQKALDTATSDEAARNDDLRTASTNAYIDAFIANRDFGKATAATPFFVTKRDGFADRLKTSTDPSDRVLLYGEPMEKRIVIRGRADDVETVRRLIALLDRPQGQAEITVYNAELSSATEPGKMEQTRIALRVLDTELARYSLYNEASQSLLRQAISAVVQAEPITEGKVLDAIKGILPNGTASTDSSDRRIPNDAQIGISVAWVMKQSKQLQTTLICMDPRVLRGLGIGSAVRGLATDYFSDLPDVTSPASLAEATLTLSLLRPDLREKVVNAYYNEIDKRFQNVVPELAKQSDIFKPSDHPTTFRPKSFLKVFESATFDVRTPGNADKWDGKGLNTKSATSDQRSVNEVRLDGPTYNAADINLLQDGFGYVYETLHHPEFLQPLSDARRDLVDQVPALQKAADDFQKFVKENDASLDPDKEKTRLAKTEEFLKKYPAAFKAGQEALLQRLVALAAKYNHPLKQDAVLRLQATNFPAIVNGLGSTEERMVRATHAVHTWFEDFDSVVDDFRKDMLSVIYGGPDYHRQIARYNLALRRVMTLYYTDVQNILVNGDQGLITNVDKILKWSRAEVGAWNSETILASNRLSARIDPQASASAQQSSPIDALGGSLVLANLVTSTASQNIPQMLQGLKDLQGKQREDAPAVYGIGTGNVFEVTPVVDPTGQALRFRFNYVASTRVREPNGVTDRQLNHVEQNSVNTEVVLDNLAIRRVSAFQSNVQLGLPAAKTGGLPIFKDLPVLKEIPLLGWFTYRIGGRKPVVQQSVILTQAAIYPTIEEVVNSLSVAYKQK